MQPVLRFDPAEANEHPPYEDPNLKALLSGAFRSADGRFLANYWKVESGGQLLERPETDELICVLEGSAVVEADGETYTATAGDVILWTKDNTPSVTVEAGFLAFCVVARS